MADFTIKQGNVLPAIVGTLEDATGAAVDLSGATLRFVMSKGVGTTPKVNAVASIDNAAQGLVSYAWTAADTDTAGWWVGEWQVTYTIGSRPETFPNDGYLTIEIVPKLV